MKEAKDQLTVVNADADTISESIGISPERTVEITKRVDEIAKDEFESGEGSPLNVFVKVYNEFEDPKECGFAMFILSHEEEKVAVHSLFRLPVSVE